MSLDRSLDRPLDRALDAPRGVETNLLLDSYPGAVFGGSFARRLSKDYNGPLVRVRRSSDNAEADIGFAANNQLDEAALLAHCGAGDGFVSRLYNQNGDGNHIEQITTSLQFRIVNSGAVTKDNGKPCAQSLSGGGGMGSPFPASSYLSTVFVRAKSLVASYPVGTGAARFANFSFDGTNNRFYFGAGTGYVSGQMGARFGSAAALDGDANAAFGTDQFTLSAFASSSSGQFWINGNLSLSVDPTEGGGTITSQQCALSNGGAGGYWDGYYFEVISYPVDNRVNREAIESNLSSFYG